MKPSKKEKPSFRKTGVMMLLLLGGTLLAQSTLAGPPLRGRLPPPNQPEVNCEDLLKKRRTNPRLPIPADCLNGGGNRGNQGRVIRQPPVIRGDEHDEFASKLIKDAMENVRCELLGNRLRRMSNTLATATELAHSSPNGDITPRERARMRAAKRLVQNREFWERLWDRLAQAYESCDRACFDDGEAVGQLSAMGYCAASIGADGLRTPGMAFQPPLPLCENSIFVGCQSNYRTTARNYEGCSQYTNGDYSQVFTQYVSQDCRVD